MNIKSLLLGSAAALVAVSGARAADAVVIAEPEPMEYVRVCDVYGEGFFYIPGTETCLRVHGYVRFDVAGGDLVANRVSGNFITVDDLDDDGIIEDGEFGSVDYEGPDDSYNTNARFSFRTTTKSETELGTLTTYTETRFNYGDGDRVNSEVAIVDPVTGDLVGIEQFPGSSTGTSVSLNFAWIQLGGLRVGKDESVFTTFTGYAGNVIFDDLVPYGPFDTNLISYYFDAGNGFSAVVSLEEGEGTDEIQDYIPHVVVGAKYGLAFGAISGVAAYDSQNEEFAGKLRLDVAINEQFSAFVMGGYKTNDGDIEDIDDPFDANDGSNFYGNWEGGDDDEFQGGDGFAVWAGASYVFTPQATVNAQVAYDEGENFAANLNVAYELVPGFTITPEVAYADNFDDDDLDGDDDDGEFGAIVRFQRSF